MKKELNQILANNTGQGIRKIANDTERDFFMSAKEAKEYGLIDSVVDKSKK
jgi:ATP-dependent Clp protease protease subunit